MKSNKKNEYKTLLSALAYGAPDEAQKLVLKYGEEKADNYEDLEYKLAKIYSSFPDKIELEKQFAAIHPHSKFILKYLSPKKVDRPLEPIQEKEIKTDTGTQVLKNIVVHDGYENADGETTSNCCGCHYCNKLSSADGITSVENKKGVYFDSLVLLGIIAVVGIVAITKNKI